MQPQSTTPKAATGAAKDVTYAACPKCLRLNKISIARASQSRPTCGACKTEIDVHGAIVNVTAASLQKLLQASPLPVLIDFWAPWCGPCRAFAPTFERVANETAGQAVFVKINTEAEPSASQTYGVRGIPTLALFSGGREILRESGALPYEHFKPWVQAQLAGIR